MFPIFFYRNLFYLQLKADLKNGDIRVPEGKVGLIGSLMAQSEMGDAPPRHGAAPLVYPEYFANWKDGYPRRIGIEHKQLKGTLKINIGTVSIYIC